MTKKTVDEMVKEHNEKIHRALKIKKAKFIRELKENEKNQEDT
jgi:hypothetical protein